MTEPRLYGVYLVTGSREYRGHKPASQFEALLDRNAEQRAIDRGDIQLLRRITPTVPDGYRLGDWPPPTFHHNQQQPRPRKGPHPFKEGRK